MSRPWLKDDFERQKSRSRSPHSQLPRVDQFGRTLPQRSRSRSRSRSRGRSRDSMRDRTQPQRGRLSERPSRTSSGSRRNEGRDKDRRRRSSSSSDSSGSSVHSRLVVSDKPKYLNARVFVANIVSKEVTKDDLIKHFEKYGNVVDVLVHPKNYAFVQYLKEDHARLAVEGEHGSTLNGYRLDVKMANENRGAGNRGGRGGRGSGRGRGGGAFGDRDRSPIRDPSGLDPYDGPYGPRRYPPPLPGDYGAVRDPFLPPDPYRRGYPDPWLAPLPDDPYRYPPDPYRDPYAPRAPPPPPPPVECEVFIVNSKLRAYGEAVELRVKDQSIITALSIIPEGRTAPQMIEETTARGGLFAIFINPQNEEHRSLTVNILHGTPQEHRNMPLDDAITLVGRSFQKYVEGLREKATAAAAPAASAPTRVFLPPSQEVAYLLNLLADNRALTVAEIDSIIKYLKERRDKLLDAESRPLITDDGYVKSPASFIKSPSQSKDKDLTSKDKMEITHKELTNKILSIFNSAGGSIQGVPPASSSKESSKPTGTPAPPPPPPPAASTASSGASLINFDNPNVQAALDNLIQSSPNLLKNISPSSTTSTKVTASSSGSSRAAISQYGAYGEADDLELARPPHGGAPPPPPPGHMGMPYGPRGYGPPPGGRPMY